MAYVVSREVVYFVELRGPSTARAPVAGFVKVGTGQKSKVWRSKQQWPDDQKRAAKAEAIRLRHMFEYDVAVSLCWFTTTVHHDGEYIFTDTKESN